MNITGSGRWRGVDIGAGATYPQSRSAGTALLEAGRPARTVQRLTPADKLAGRESQIFARRDQKLAEAREKRRQRRAGISSTSAPVGS